METGSTKRVFGIRGSKLITQLLGSVVLLAAAGYSTMVQAVPVTYTETIGTASGGLGDMIITNQLVQFVMTSDTDNVFYQPYPGGEAYVNAVGTITVNIFDAADPTQLAMSAVFDVGEVYLSVDNTNNGIGFGTFTASGDFDPVYPYALFGPDTTTLASYDLTTDINFAANGLSCSGFPSTCANTADSPVYLSTNMGAFYMTSQGLRQSFFSAVTSPVANVPEPAALSLLPLSLGILGLFRRKSGEQRAS